jgi:hypothetical protein
MKCHFHSCPDEGTVPIGGGMWVCFKHFLRSFFRFRFR